MPIQTEIDGYNCYGRGNPATCQQHHQEVPSFYMQNVHQQQNQEKLESRRYHHHVVGSSSISGCSQDHHRLVRNTFFYVGRQWLGRNRFINPGKDSRTVPFQISRHEKVQPGWISLDSQLGSTSEDPCHQICGWDWECEPEHMAHHCPIIVS